MGHIRQLDGIRALAIMLVFAAHLGLEKLVPGGLGVTLFFFLSGFLITSLLRLEQERTGQIDIKGFYLRRSLRIWPPLYISILLILPLMAWLPNNDMSFAGVASQALFASNYWAVDRGVAIPLWSLAVEEHFYILFPLLYIVWLSRLTRSAAFRACVAMCAVVLLVRFATAAAIGPDRMIYFWSHTRADSILFGCCLALWRNPALDADAWRPGLRGAALAVLALLLCLVIRNELFRQTIRYTIQGAAIGVLFCYVLQTSGLVTRLLSSTVAEYMGRYSYSFYLVHMFVLAALKEQLHPPLWLLALLGFAISMTYAALMNVLVEIPANRLKKRLQPAKALAAESRLAEPGAAR